MKKDNPILKYLPTIMRIINSSGDLTMVEAPDGFPFDTAYPGQVVAVKDIEENEDILLSSATGSGKTAVFLTPTVGVPSVVIEPRKYLQSQCSGYKNDCVVFGRNEYSCKYEENAADAPCRGKKETYLIDERPVTMFTTFDERTGKEERVPYPCPGCQYISAVKSAIAEIKSCGTVITNFGNYFPYLDSAKVIVIDEADLFFASISTGHRLRFLDYPKSTTKETLDLEVKAAKRFFDESSGTVPTSRADSRAVSKRIDKAKTHHLSMKSLLENHDLCFQYVRQNRQTGKTSVYIEIRPDKLMALKERMFPVVGKDGTRRKIITVTATPGRFTAEKVISYSVFMRTAIFYSPVSLMTASYTNNHPEAFEKCAEFIQSTHGALHRLFGEKEGKKAVVHCGSLANAKTMETLLGGIEKCDLHTTGNLMKIVEGFRESPAEYLLVTAAEYGASFDYATHQYILRAPQYATFDERLRCLQGEMKEAEFNDWYTLDALYRTVQQSGRVGRGAGGIGFTFILDRKFGETYGRYYDVMPPSFVEAIERGGTM